MLITNVFYFLLALLLHETAHLIAARMCGVTITEFGIGWGESYLGFGGRMSISEFRLLPVGAYVRFDLNELQQRPLAQQVLILLAGIIVNLVAATATSGTRFSLMNFLLAATKHPAALSARWMEVRHGDVAQRTWPARVRWLNGRSRLPGVSDTALFAALFVRLFYAH